MTRPRCASTVTANLLAEVVAVDVFKADELRNAFAGAHRREIEARIFEHTKRTVGIHVYLTDSKGVVVFDSDGGRRYAERYIQTLTHEMKSPLAAIRGAAELLDEEMPVEVRKRFLENIRAETARSERLINRLLELAAIEGRTSLETAGEVDFHAIVARAIDQARPLAEVAGVQLADRWISTWNPQAETSFYPFAITAPASRTTRGRKSSSASTRCATFPRSARAPASALPSSGKPPSSTAAPSPWSPRRAAERWPG